MVMRGVLITLLTAWYGMGYADEPGRIMRLAELSTQQIRALDRDRTAVLMPGGIVEQHGPYLPSFSDGYYNEHLTAKLATAISAKPGWSVLIFPTIPIGSGGANEIGEKFSFPGTYAVRPETLRAVYMDLASEFGEQGFQWIFVIHAHGSPDHNRALDDAGDYFQETYGGRMVNLWGLMVEEQGESIIRSELGEEALSEDGFTVHAGLAEHSILRYLRPDLVSETVSDAPNITARHPGELAPIARDPDWPGYFGSPRLASEKLGEKLLQASVNAYVSVALEILDEENDLELRRYADFMAGIPPIEAVMERSREHDAKRELKHKGWLLK